MLKQEPYGWYAGSLLLCAVALMALAGRLPLPASLALWCGLAAVLFRFAPRVRVPADRPVRRTALAYAFFGAAAYLAALYLAGAFMGALAASPYNRSPAGLLGNLLRVMLPLFVRELVRAYGFGAAWRVCRYRGAAIAAITLAFFLADLRYARLLSLSGARDAVSYITQSVAPALAREIFLSVLVFYGGAGAGIVYAAIPAAFEWSFPYLPNLPWLAQGAVGLCVPLVLALMTADRFRAQKRGDTAGKERETVGFFAVLAACVLFAWFVVGVFPVYPSVVLTGSMEPLIAPGDAVLIQKLSSEGEIYRLSEGEIINFKRDKITITHRIVGVMKDEAGNVSFQTKGDNNDSADVQPVLPNDINGTVRQVIPKVGLPVLLMKSGEAVPEGVTDHE